MNYLPKMGWSKAYDRHEQQWSYYDCDRLIATIFFIDGKFDRVWFGFKGNYSRDEWKMLVAIEKQISRIEKSLK